MADPEIDQFAQTRGADDLFDDEIIPVSAEEQVQTVEPTPAPVTEENIAALERDAPPPAPRADTPRSRGGERRGRGRGRGRARQASRKRGGDGGSQAKSTENSSVPEQEKNGDPESKRDAPAEPTAEDPSKDEGASTDTKEVAADGQRVPAVRGDRSATGGVRKPKLTEEELSKKIAAAKEHAAKVAAAHARAEADQASFLEREKVADAKRRQERAHRRVMDSERERNRQRKLNAVTGREWDSQKQEEDYNGSRGGRGNFRGMHGGVTGQVRRGLEDSRWATAPEETPSDEPSESHSHHHHHNHSPRGRGRGGRRGGRGRGGHRGHDEGAPPQRQQEKPAAPALNSQAEFPALPGDSKKPSTSAALSPEKATTSTTKPDPLSPLSPVEGSWADQVESQ